MTTTTKRNAIEQLSSSTDQTAQQFSNVSIESSLIPHADTENPKKRFKPNTPIQSQSVDEVNAEIQLKIATMEVRQLKKYMIYVLHATDGYDFIQVEAKGKAATRLFAEVSEEHKGAIFRFTGVGVLANKPEYNYGSVSHMLQIRHETKINQVIDCKDEHLVGYGAEEAFYEHLKGKFFLANTIEPTTLGTIKKFKSGETNACLQFQLDTIEPVRLNKIPACSMNSAVQQFGISQNKQTARLYAWDIEAWFLGRFLQNSVGQSIVATKLRFKSDHFGRQFTFGRNSKLKLLDKDEAALALAPITLQELVNNNKPPTKQPPKQQRTHLNIPFMLIDTPAVYNLKQHILVATGTDGHHKAQCFFPASFGFKKGSQFQLVAAHVNHFESGVLNIRMSTEADFKPIETSELNTMPFPTKAGLRYPDNEP